MADAHARSDLHFITARLVEIGYAPQAGYAPRHSVCNEQCKCA